MIPKGMKVGDTFEDGGVMHRVLKVVGDNYESEVIGGKVVKEPKTEEITPDNVNYEELPYAQLKKLCAERGLNAAGTKADLIARLEG